MPIYFLNTYMYVLGLDEDWQHCRDGSITSPPPRCPPFCPKKRIRTTFKHHQLNFLRCSFALNQNPDPREMEQMAQKIGLVKRNIKVGLCMDALKLPNRV